MQALEGPNSGQVVGEVVVDHVFPILISENMSNNCRLHFLFGTDAIFHFTICAFMAKKIIIMKLACYS